VPPSDETEDLFTCCRTASGVWEGHALHRSGLGTAPRKDKFKKEEFLEDKR